MKRHVPQRTCVGCGRKERKDTLLRLYVSTAATLMVDIRQRESGRGMYVCAQRSCIHQALKRRRFLKHYPKVILPKFAEFMANVEEQLLQFVGKAKNKGLAASGQDLVALVAERRSSHVRKALAHYISLSSERGGPQ